MGERQFLKIIDSWNALKSSGSDNLILALGNFDGVHRGHQALINKAVEWARRVGCKAGVFTFYPHPQEILSPEDHPLLLLPIEDRIKKFKDLSVDVSLVLPFCLSMAGKSPEGFVEQVLVKELGVKGIVIGYNYSFGKGGKGSPELLKELGKKLGFEVEIIQPVRIENHIVSSTLIRRLLSMGKVSEAAQYLGYYPFVRGVVEHGAKRGRTIGFPTANLRLPVKSVVPALGVYAAQVEIKGRLYGGVVNIGYRPTVNSDQNIANLEVNIFQFEEDIYGQEIKVELIECLRGEERFNSLEELKGQINKDVFRAREILVGLSGSK